MFDLLSKILFVIWLGMPLGAWIMRLATGKRVHGFLLYVIAVILGYFTLLGSVWATDVWLTQRMNSFDVDGDGGIGGAELTPEAEQAMNDWANDTGRTLAVFTGVPFTMIWAAICLTPLCLGEWLVRRTRGRNDPAPPAPRNFHRPPDDGNPYHAVGSD